MSKEAGFSVSELLIGLLLASLIVQALTAQYLSVKRQFYHRRQLISTAYDQQLIIEFIQDSVRRAGFTPCVRLDALISTQVLQPIEVDVQTSAIHVQRMNEQFDLIKAFLSPMRLLTHAKRFRSGQTVLIADCQHAEIRRIDDVCSAGSGQRLLLSEPLLFQYQPPVYIGEWISERFYFKNKALYYAFQRSEILSSNVACLRASIKQVAKRILLSVMVQFDYGKPVQFETLVRI